MNAINNAVKAVKTDRGRFFTWMFAIILIAVIFAIDCVTPSDRAAWSLYLLPNIFLIFRSESPKKVYWTVSSSSLLMIIAFLLKPFGHDPGTALLNLALGLVIIWVISVLFIGREKSKRIIQASEERFKATFEQRAVGVAQIAENGRLLHVNQAFAEMLLYKPEELLEKNFRRIVYHDDLWFAVENFRRVWNGEVQAFSVEFRLNCSTGKIIWTSFNGSLLSIITSGANYLIGVAIDITDRKDAEILLKESEERFRRTFEQAAAGIAHLSFDGHWLRVNRKFCEIVGYSKEELEPLTFQDITHPDDIKEDLILREKVYRGEMPSYSMEKRYIRKDGSVVWVILTGSMVREEHRGNEYFVSILEDITKLKEAEAKLQTQKIRAEILSEISHKLAQSSFDYKAVLEVAVRRTSETLGDMCVIRLISGEENWLLPAAFYHPDPRKMAISEEMFNKLPQKADEGLSGYVIKTGKPLLIPVLDQEEALKDLKKEYLPYVEQLRHYSTVAVPMRSQGKIIGILSLSRDNPGNPFTGEDQSFLQELGDRIALAITNADLYKRNLEEIEERKQYQEALNLTLKELERSNSELEQFAYVASHDLQEPLRMISGYIKLISKTIKDISDPKLMEFLKFIAEGSVRMQDLIHDLLAYSRISTKAKPFETVDMEKVIEEVMDNLKIAIQESQAKIHHEKLPKIYGDHVQLIQLFQNLITNAIKFRSAFAPVVVIDVKESEDEWVFSVKDNGIGIDPKFFDRIFQIFQRLHERHLYPGTGIGLAVCKKIVERHGGNIWVESDRVNGSKFNFTITKKNLPATLPL